MLRVIVSGGRRAGETRRDDDTPADRFTSQTKSSPEPAGCDNVAWNAYRRNNHRGDEHSPSNRPRDGNQRKEEETRTDGQNCGDNRGNRSDSGNQWKDDRGRETRKGNQNCGDNRGNRADSGNQWNDDRGRDIQTQRDAPDCGNNRGNCSLNGNQWRDVLESQDYGSCRGNRSDNAGDWRADLERYRRDSQDFRYKHGNECDGRSERNSPREGDGRWGDCRGYTDTRKSPQRQQANTEARRGFSGGNFRNDSEHRSTDKQSRSNARSAYHPRSPEYQPNVPRFNRSPNAKHDSGYGNKGAFDNSVGRDGNQRSTYKPRKVKLDLGPNSNNCDDWDFFDEGPRTGSPQDRFETGSRGCSSRRGFPKSPNVEIKVAVEELWDLEPVHEKPAPETKQEGTPTAKTTGDNAEGSALRESSEFIESGRLMSAGQGSAAGTDAVPHKLKSAENMTSAPQEVDKSDSTGRLCNESVEEVTKSGTPVTSGLKVVAQGEDIAGVPGVNCKEVEKHVPEKSASDDAACRGETGGAGGKGGVLGGKTEQERACTAKKGVIAEEGLEEREGAKTGEVVKNVESTCDVGTKGDASEERPDDDLKETDEDVVADFSKTFDPQRDDARDEEMEAGQGNENLECGNVEQKSLVEVSEADDSGRDQKEEGQTDAGSVYSPPEVSFGRDSSITFMLSHVESPSLFWVHPVSEKSSNAIDKVMRELNQCYKTANKMMLKKFFEGDNDLALNTICCAQFSEDNDFYRTEIVSVRYEVEEAANGAATVAEGGDASRSSSQSRKLAKVKVFYLDFGNSEWLSPKRVYPLPPMFTALAPQAVCCRLVDLEPIAATDSGAGGDGVMSDATWSSEAMQTFNELTGFDKQLYGYVTTCNKEALR